jgi:hypothetical protein
MHRVKRHRRQLVAFTEETNATRSKNVKIDLVMDGWLPWERIEKALRRGSFDGHMQVQVDDFRTRIRGTANRAPERHPGEPSTHEGHDIGNEANWDVRNR